MPWIVLGVVFVLTGFVAAGAIARVVHRHRTAILGDEAAPLRPTRPAGEGADPTPLRLPPLADLPPAPEDTSGPSVADEAHAWLDRQR